MKDIVFGEMKKKGFSYKKRRPLKFTNLILMLMLKLNLKYQTYNVMHTKNIKKIIYHMKQKFFCVSTIII